jgi:ubiquinone/menaquinone biosynthesis C-methylase UbiE
VLAYLLAAFNAVILLIGWEIELSRNPILAGMVTFQYQIGLAAIERLQPRDGERILDIGCGTGRLAVQIAQQIPNGQVVGIDISQSMIGKAEQVVVQSGLANIELTCMDAMAIKFDGEFDAVLANSVFEFVPGPTQLAKKVYSALKPGGRICLTVLAGMPAPTGRGLERSGFARVDFKTRELEGVEEELQATVYAKISQTEG